MTLVFYAWPYCTFIEILRNLRGEKRYRINQMVIFLEAVLAIYIT